MKVTIIEKCMNCGEKWNTPVEYYNDLGVDFPIPVVERAHICQYRGSAAPVRGTLVIEKGLIKVIGCIEEE